MIVVALAATFSRSGLPRLLGGLTLLTLLTSCNRQLFPSPFHADIRHHAKANQGGLDTV